MEARRYGRGRSKSKQRRFAGLPTVRQRQASAARLMNEYRLVSGIREYGGMSAKIPNTIQL